MLTFDAPAAIEREPELAFDRSLLEITNRTQADQCGMSIFIMAECFAIIAAQS